MNITIIGIHLAKNVFSVHGVDAHGKVVLKKTVTRSKLLDCDCKACDSKEVGPSADGT